MESLLNFIEGNNSNLDQSDYDTSYKVWSGFDIVVRLKGIGLGPDSFKEYQVTFCKTNVWKFPINSLENINCVQYCKWGTIEWFFL